MSNPQSEEHQVTQTAPREPSTAVLVLVVELDGHRLGLRADGVVAIHQVVQVTPLPGAPDVVEGVVNHRGVVVGVVDLRARFGLVRRPPLLSDHLVIARSGTRLVGLRVDRAVDLVTVAPEDVEDRVGVPLDGPVPGVAKLSDGLVLIHDLASFLSTSEAVQLDRALAAAEGATP